MKKIKEYTFLKFPKNRFINQEKTNVYNIVVVVVLALYGARAWKQHGRRKR